MFVAKSAFEAPTKAGAVVFDVAHRGWSEVGMKHTKRNQRKVVRFYRFYEGINVIQPTPTMQDFDCVAFKLYLRCPRSGDTYYWPFNFTYEQARTNAEYMRTVLTHANDIGLK